MQKRNYIKFKGLINIISLSLLFLQPYSSKKMVAQIVGDPSDKFLGGSTGNEIFRYFGDYWNQMTPGNAGKWGSVEFSQGQYYWDYLDQLYNFCTKRNILFKQHTMIWGNQQPAWINSLDSTGQYHAVENWIKNFAERYPNTALVDVVNEPLNDPPSYYESLGGNGVTGWDWVVEAFEMARLHFSNQTKLVLNEYNILHSNSRTTEYLNIIKILKDRNLIDGIGIQGHYFEFRGEIGSSNNYVYSIATIKANLNRLAETGLDIYMTEFDIDEPDDQNQLEQYQIYFPIFWEHPSIKGITLWGFIEGDVWNSHPNTYVMKSDRTERPSLQWLRSYVNSPFAPILISPNTSSTVERNPVFKWNATKNADSYNLQLAKSANFTNLTIDTLVTDTIYYIDSLEINTRYYWRIKAINDVGESMFSEVRNFLTNDQITGVDTDKLVIKNYKLLQNYPNPFNPTTIIRYAIPEAGFVKLEFFNILGKSISSKIEEQKSAGIYEILFNGINLPSGVYYYKLTTKNFNQTRKMILIK